MFLAIKGLIENIVECKDHEGNGVEVYTYGLIENIVECKDYTLAVDRKFKKD